MIQLKNLSKHFTTVDGPVDALRHINLTVNDGDIYGIIGMSGAGKSTLVRCINMLERPTEGNVILDGRDLGTLSNAELRKVRRKVTMIFQSFNLLMQRTCLKNVMLPLKLIHMPREQAEKRAMELLELVGLPDKANSYPAQLSGGQQQRVAIARALVVDSDVLVMDEPITNLDAKLREEMLLEIRMIQKRLNATILYITHDQQSALQLCDKMAIMQQDGTLCQYGTDEEIILHPANRFTFEFIGVSNFIPIEKGPAGAVLKCGGASPIPYDGEVPQEALGGGYELGVRPNDIVFDPSSPIQAHVTSRVFLGSEYNYFLNIGEKQVRVQQSMLDARTRGVAKEGETVGIRFLNTRFYPAKKGEQTV